MFIEQYIPAIKKLDRYSYFDADNIQYNISRKELDELEKDFKKLKEVLWYSFINHNDVWLD